jgi:hypothetical protein
VADVDVKRAVKNPRLCPLFEAIGRVNKIAPQKITAAKLIATVCTGFIWKALLTFFGG